MRRFALLAVLTLLTAGPTAAHGPSVKLSYGRVTPPQLAIRAGDTVHFHNHSTTPRTFTVRGAEGSFEGPPLPRGEGWHHTFEEAGRYDYAIVEMPGMKGTILVGPGQE